MVTGRVWAEFHVVRGQEATPIGGMRSSNTTVGSDNYTPSADGNAHRKEILNGV